MQHLNLEETSLQNPAMLEGGKRPRAESPPPHLILTTAGLIALGPPRHVRVPRRLVRAPHAESFACPPPAVEDFLGNVLAGLFVPLEEAKETSKTISLPTPTPVHRPATEVSQAVLPSFFPSKKKVPVPASPKKK